jgi:hypothetical protein
MKKTLLSLLGIMLTILGYAQTGSITIINIPTTVTAGTTVDLDFTYTSDVDVSFVVQLFRTNPGATTPDYSTYQTAFTVPAQPAGTDVPITVSIPIPSGTVPSSAIGTREYTFDLKLTPTAGGTDFGYSNGTSAHTIEILASSSPAGSITVDAATVPDQIEVGATGAITFTYTSNVDVDIFVEMFTTNAGATAVDFTTYKIGVNVQDQPAGVDVPITVNVPIPAALPLSSTLGNRQYTFALKLKPALTTGDFAYSNGTANHTVEIIASTVVIDAISFTSSTPASINPGDVLTIDFQYTLPQARNLKAGLVIYTSAGGYFAEGPSGSIQYFSSEPATTTTPVTRTVNITMPAGITPSADLPAGQVYKVVVGINTTADGYIVDAKNDITVNALTTGIRKNNAIVSKLNVFPNPATDVVNISYPGTIESVVLYHTSGSKVDMDATPLSNGLFNINTSALEKGVYILMVSTNEGIASVKLVK